MAGCADAGPTRGGGSTRGEGTHSTFQLTAESLTLNTFDLSNRRKNTSTPSKDILWQSVLFCISGKVQVTAARASAVTLHADPACGFLPFCVTLRKRLPRGQSAMCIRPRVHSSSHSSSMPRRGCACVSSQTSGPGRAGSEHTPCACPDPQSRRC